jgi:AcrR family transcriptional regulator
MNGGSSSGDSDKTKGALSTDSARRTAKQRGGTERSISPLRRRDRLVVAALKLFSERPFDDVSVDDIANEADVAYGLLSYHFGGKRGVYLAALQMVQTDLQVLTRPIQSDGGIAAQIKGMARRHFEYFRAHPQVLLGLLASAPSDTDTRAIAESAQAAGAQALFDLLGMSDDPPPMLQMALRGCMGFMQEITIRWLGGQDELSNIERLVDLCFDVTVAAVANAVDQPTGVVLALTTSSAVS